MWGESWRFHIIKSIHRSLIVTKIQRVVYMVMEKGVIYIYFDIEVVLTAVVSLIVPLNL